MSYTVYMHTSPSGKKYIGITRRRPRKRFDNGRGYSHSPHMSAAIKKYGWETFTHDILAEGLSEEEACKMEIELIARYRTTDPAYGYNVTSGGEHAGELTPEGRERLAARMRSSQNPVYVYGSPMKGKNHTDESRRKMSVAASKRKRQAMTEDLRLAIREGHSFEMKAVRCVESGVVYPGIHEAADATGCTATAICAVCKGRRKSTHGLHWEYVHEAEG